MTKEFPLAKRLFGPRSARDTMRAVDAVSLHINAGECLAVVGESGCGKSTLARLVLGLTEPTGGEIRLRGEELTNRSGREGRRERAGIQAVFQDPGGSLDPQMRVGEAVAEPLAVRRAGTAKDRRAKVAEMLERVGIPSRSADRYPHQFSGGQKQRIAIARALIVDPDLIVCDEPLTALDVSIQSQILELLRGIQERHEIAYLFISHDLAVVRQIAQRVVVMYLGTIVETGPVEQLFAAPAHPYTGALLDARPVPDPVEERRRDHVLLPGPLPSVYDPPGGCPFHTRCWKAQDVCRVVRPPLEQVEGGQWAACHFPLARRGDPTAESATPMRRDESL